MVVYWKWIKMHYLGKLWNCLKTNGLVLFSISSLAILVLYIFGTLLLEGRFSVPVGIIALVFIPTARNLNVSKSWFKAHSVSLKTEQCAPTLKITNCLNTGKIVKSNISESNKSLQVVGTTNPGKYGQERKEYGATYISVSKSGCWLVTLTPLIGHGCKWNKVGKCPKS